MRHFENMSEKHYFFAILGKNGKFWTFMAKRGPILNFPPKSETDTFLRLWNQGWGLRSGD